MKRIAVMTALCLFAAVGSLRADDTLWARVYNPGSSDAGTAVATIGTDIYLAGNTTGANQNALILKYGGDGVRAWFTVLDLDTMEQAMDVAVTTDSGPVVGIWVQSVIPGLSLVRMNKNGDTVWTRHRRGLQPSGLAINGQNEIYAFGSIRGIGPSESAGIIKYSAAGAVLFDRSYRLGQGVEAAGCAIDAGGNVVAGATVLDTAGQYPLIVKFNSNGDTTWQVRLTVPPGVRLNGLAVAPNDCILLSLMAGGLKTLVMKLGPTGSVIWTESIPGGIMPMNYRTIAVDADSNVYVAVSDSAQIGRVARLNAQGARTWYGQCYTRAQLRSVAVDCDEHPVAVGGSMEPVGCLTVKFTGVAGIVEDRPRARGSTGAAALQVEPNPCRDAVTIRYALTRTGNVSLKLYDLTGALVTTLARGCSTAGSYTAALDGTKLARGIYVLKLNTDGLSTTRKLIIE